MTYQRQFFSNTISDSFLRSYSLSRIVRINEQNRNKAKVTIVRKLRALKDETKKTTIGLTKVSTHKKQIDSKTTNIRSLKQRLDLIDSPKVTPQNEKKTCRQCEIAKSNEQKYKISKKQRNQQTLQNMKHRRFNSAILQQQKENYYNVSSIIKKHSVKQEQLKTSLRMSQITFQQSKLLRKKNIISTNIQQRSNQNLNISLSSTLNSFNRLKLMTNAKSSEKILQHFYKRSLQNCTLEDLKFLIKIQKDKKQQEEKRQNCVTPMRFGKIQPLRRQDDQNQFQKQKIQKKASQQIQTEWNNEMLRQNCPLKQKKDLNTIKNNKIEDSSTIQNEYKRKSSEKLGEAKCALSKKTKSLKQNVNEYDQMQQLESEEAQIQKNLIYCFRDKKFPTNQNKLNKVYQNWQSQFLRKRRLQQNYKNSQKLYQQQENRQLRTKSIKIKKAKQYEIIQSH